MHSRTLAAALALLTVLFIGFSWWVYASSGGRMHWAVPVACTLVPLIIAAVVFVMQRLTAKQGAQGLERALAAEAVREQRAMPARSAEVERLKNEFERAVGALKNSKLARSQGNAREALYRLPWYTIIGPPASGKTTVLRNSGLKFPHLAGTGDRLKGIGGTRNCDWWLTNHAILLDTAGRWTLEDDDRDEWLAFLDLLKRHRGQRPLNGVLAAISIAGDEETSLASADPAGVKMLAGRMRERLDEITSHLGLELPVYLMFTKCDLVSGFVETFGSLGPDERKQIWGFTAPLLSAPMSAPGAYFSEQFEVLCNALEQHALTRMGQEVRGDVIAKIFEFPAQFRSLDDKLSGFVEELFEESAYGEAPILRGAYFTSGTQEGAPADLLLEQMSEAMNVRPMQQELDGEKKSYFLHDMLMDVVFEDRHMATASQAELVRQQKFRRQWTSGLLVGALLIAALPTYSCQQNLSAIARTRALLERVQAGVSPELNAQKPARVDELAALNAEAVRYEQGMPSMLAGFGLYQGDDLREPVSRYETAALKEWLIRPLLNKSNQVMITVTQQLEGLRAQGGELLLDDATRRALHDALALHLLLSVPRASCVPKPIARKEWLLTRLSTLYQQVEPSSDHAALMRRKTLLLRYLEQLSEHEAELAFSADKRRVELSRLALGAEDKVSQLLSGVLDRFSKDPRDFTRLAGASGVLNSSESVSGAFTLDAWRQTSREMASTKPFSSSDESWVLGCDQSNAEELRAAQNSAQFQDEYFKRYEEQWRRFLNGISARSPSTALEAESMFAELVGRPGVLGTLFQRVKEHTDLPPPPPLSVKAAADSLVDKAVGQAAASGGVLGAVAGAVAPPPASGPSPAMQKLTASFAELVRFGVGKEGAEAPLEQYRRQAETVLMALKAYRADESKIDALGAAARSALDNTELLLSNSPSDWTGRLREILVPPLAGVINIAMHDRGGQVQRLWCDLVYRPYQAELGGRYPMQTDTTSASTLQAFARFFQPGAGLIWSFQTGQLGSYVSQEGERFRFSTQQSADSRALFRDELLYFLNRALEVQKAFFPGNAAAIRMPFRIRVRGAAGYSVTSFSVGAKNVRYDSGVESWVNIEWPGEQPSLGATLAVTPYQGAGPKPLNLASEWGLFMILDERLGHGNILERGDRVFTAGWKPKGSQNWVKVDFSSDDAHSPILQAPFGRMGGLLPLAVPARITHAGSGC